MGSSRWSTPTSRRASLRRLGDRSQLSELLIAVLHELLRGHPTQLAQVAAEHEADVLRGGVPVAVRPARRLVDQLVDDAQLEGVARGELERLRRFVALARVPVEDGRAQLRADHP